MTRQRFSQDLGEDSTRRRGVRWSRGIKVIALQSVENRQEGAEWKQSK